MIFIFINFKLTIFISEQNKKKYSKHKFSYNSLLTDIKRIIIAKLFQAALIFY